MSFDEIKTHLDRLFAYRPIGSSREQASGLREALVEFKAALIHLHATLETSEKKLDQARTNVVDYERRREMAEKIKDAKTVEVADEYLAKARERVDLLERKVLVLRDEVTIAEREYEATKLRYQRADRGLPLEAASATLDPETGEPVSTLDDPFLDKRAKQAAVEAQLEMLKKKLGRE
jgi:hypothetical protein